MRRRGEFDGYDALVADAVRLPEVLLAVKRRFDPDTEIFAEAIRDTP